MSSEAAIPPASTAAVREALARLGVDRFVLGVHEAALPSAPGPETGRGSLDAPGGRAFAEVASALGFDALQLGPAGMTDRDNPSPYDGALFSRNLLAIDLQALAEAPEWGRLLPRAELAAILGEAPPGATRRVPYRWAWDASRRALRTAWGEVGRRVSEPDVAALTARAADFRAAHAEWLEADGLYEALAESFGSHDWRSWPDRPSRMLWAPPQGSKEAASATRRRLVERHADTVDWWTFSQLLLAEQHHRGRSHARGLGLALYGDLQVGMSLRDSWRLQALFLPGYRLGAPPSRTNPEGQPWGFPVLHPDLAYASGAHPAEWPAATSGAALGPALRYFAARAARIFSDYDGLRVDHPHGLVCPWVYRDGDADPALAARRGARLLGSPAEDDHPELAAWSVIRPEQVNRTVERWHDDRVADLDEAQVARYATFVDHLVAAAHTAGKQADALMCEVLSTQPQPLGHVLRRHGLGRFRITQKASLDDPSDVYRADNARPEDWVMLGTHDTPSIWGALERWQRDGAFADRACFVATRLVRDPAQRDALVHHLIAHPGALPTAMLAELLACRARHVYVFFTDLLGIAEPYNRPGVVGPQNWTLRVPPDYRERLAIGGERGTAIDIPAACTLALRARDLGDRDLLRQLQPT